MKISVIIPAYNEAACLDRTLQAVSRLKGDFELLVVDGSSTDETSAIARRCGARVLTARRSRAAQMNVGAEHARGDVLLFLHADTFLPEEAYDQVTRTLADPNVAGGCFRLGFDQHTPGLRFSAFVTRFSFPLFHFGDSAYFVRATAFRQLGGYRSYPIMEDIDLWLRLRKRHRLVVLESSVVTSARRFIRYGVFRQQCRGICLLLLFLLGVHPTRLKRFYGEVR